ncbi:MAG: tetratricopeptide repeat protein, partial [Acidobacteria bacterium]|nr:tetratricopeptide repeat protein [Acidobacteriota bacterium]
AGDVRSQASTLHDMANLSFEQGDLRRAKELWESSLSVWQNLGDLRRKAITLSNMARVSALEAEPEVALDLWARSLETFKDIKDASSMARTWTNMAGLLARQGDLPGSIDLWNSALELQQEVGDKKGEALTRSNIAWAAGQLGDYRRQLELNLEAAGILARVQAFGDLIKVLGNLGFRDEPGREVYLAQAFWLAARIQAPMMDTLNLGAAVIQRFGQEADLSPWVAAASVILVEQRGQTHPQLEQLRQGASSLLGACAQAREIPPDGFEEWLKGEGLLDPGTVFPTLFAKLEAVIGDSWLFDPTLVAG